MQFLLRLYMPADLDLILIRRQLGTRFHKLVKDCLEASAAGKKFEYAVRDMDGERTDVFDPSYQVFIRLDDLKDINLVKYVSSIPKGRRNDEIKCLVRCCYDRFPLEVYRNYFKSGSYRQVESLVKDNGSVPLVKKEHLDNKILQTKTDEIKRAPVSKPLKNAAVLSANDPVPVDSVQEVSKERQKAEKEMPKTNDKEMVPETEDDAFSLFLKMAGDI